MRMLFVAGVLAWAAAAHAEVVDAQAGGFEVRQSVHIAAPPARVYDALAHVGRWWDGAHTYSGDATHLTLEAIAGGCFCEALPDGGSAAHMRVVMAQPGKVLRLEGALGPLQRLGVSGHLTWALTPKDAGTDLVQLYDIGGYAKGGLAELAAPVDHVLSEQISRLKRYVETGTP
jgi:uncharacterized protein YndB with AHSA1/START domain